MFYSGRLLYRFSAQLAVADAVEEVDQQADRKPDEESHPGLDRKAQHQNETEQRADDREERNQWDSERAEAVRRLATQRNYAEADQDEREERADVGEVGQCADVGDHRYAANDNTGPDRSDVRCAEPLVNPGEILR